MYTPEIGIFFPLFSLIFWDTFSQTHPTAVVSPLGISKGHFLLARSLIGSKSNHPSAAYLRLLPCHVPPTAQSRRDKGTCSKDMVLWLSFSCCSLLFPCPRGCLCSCKVSMEEGNREFYHGCYTHHGVILKKNVQRLALCHGVLRWILWTSLTSSPQFPEACDEFFWTSFLYFPSSSCWQEIALFSQAAVSLGTVSWFQTY